MYIQNINANILKEIIQFNSVWIDMKILNHHVPFLLDLYKTSTVPVCSRLHGSLK